MQLKLTADLSSRLSELPFALHLKMPGMPLNQLRMLNLNLQA